MSRFFVVYYLLAFERKVVEAIIECARPVVGEATYRFTMQALMQRLQDVDEEELEDVMRRLKEANMIRVSHAVGENLGYRLTASGGDFRIAEMLDHTVEIERRPTRIVRPIELKICERMMRRKEFPRDAYQRVAGGQANGCRTNSALGAWFRANRLYTCRKIDDASYFFDATWEWTFASAQFPPVTIITREERKAPALTLMQGGLAA
ncbi:MAG: hypothetical protein Q7S89_02425 [bacterium]|nr:hypothetical protein [bacterium]